MSEHKEEITLRFLVLIGNSGSGKSVLAQKLSQEHPELFTTAVQVTTRPRRENTYDPYVFLDKYQYQQLTPLLLGKTNIDTPAGMTYYGTFLPISEKIIVIVLNETGLDDFKQYFIDNDCINYESLVIGLVNHDFEKIQTLPGRKYRDSQFLRDEVDFTMSEASYTIDTTTNYATTKHIIEILNDEEFI